MDSGRFSVIKGKYEVPLVVAQVVRARMQQRVDTDRAVQYNSFVHAFRVTLKREGFTGLYKGLVPNLLRVLPQAAVTFLVYETVMRILATQVAKQDA